MKKLKVVFMGTPKFSVPILERLIEEANVVMVVSSPDAVIGRKKILTAPPIKELAMEHNIPVFSPENIKENFEEIIKMEPDIIITCAYGQIIPKELLDLPRLGCVNIHASLLPKYRGGAPIHRAIMDGEDETGITIMYMDEKMDAGDMITSESIVIEKEDNISTLSSKLSLLGRDLIIKTLPSIVDGTNDRVKQDTSKVTYAPIITRADELLDFSKTAEEIYDHFRALSPDPLPYFKVMDMEFKIVKCEIVEETGTVSTVIAVEKDNFTVACGSKSIRIYTIQPKGKKEMSVKDFFNGFHKDILLSKTVF